MVDAWEDEALESGFCDKAAMEERVLCFVPLLIFRCCGFVGNNMRTHSIQTR